MIRASQASQRLGNSGRFGVEIQFRFREQKLEKKKILKFETWLEGFSLTSPLVLSLSTLFFHPETQRKNGIEDGIFELECKLAIFVEISNHLLLFSAGLWDYDGHCESWLRIQKLRISDMEHSNNKNEWTRHG